MSTKMILGGYTFVHNPTSMSSVIEPVLTNSHLLTYSSVSFFSWGASVVGKVVSLEWEYMKAEQYDALQTKYEAGAQIVFDPKQDATFRFNVIITDFIGTYFLNMKDTAAYRKDVKLELLIMSVV